MCRTILRQRRRAANSALFELAPYFPPPTPAQFWIHAKICTENSLKLGLRAGPSPYNKFPFLPNVGPGIFFLTVFIDCISPSLCFLQDFCFEPQLLLLRELKRQLRCFVPWDLSAHTHTHKHKHTRTPKTKKSNFRRRKSLYDTPIRPIQWLNLWNVAD